MLHFTLADLEQQARFYRANLVNSITGYKPANLIGTQGSNGIANLAIFSSVVHLGANPALLGFIQRPIIDTSHTFKNILDTGIYTINHVHQSFVEQAHYTSAKFADDQSEFNACKLTASYIKDFSAPFVAESHVKLGMQLVETVPIKHNNTTLVIGSIQHIIIENDALLLPDGTIDLSLANSIACSGLDTYYAAQRLIQLPYAKVNELPDWSKSLQTIKPIL